MTCLFETGLASNFYVRFQGMSFQNPRALIWFSQDLRSRDNLLLDWLSRSNYEALGLVFVPENVSKFRLTFFVQSVRDLQDKLREAKVQIFMVQGSPDQVLIPWIIENQISKILMTRPYNSRDQGIVFSAQKEISENTNAEILFFDQKTLLDPDDLPFKISEIPNVFTSFRQKVEKVWKVKPRQEVQIGSVVGFVPRIPDSASLCTFEDTNSLVALPFDFRGGETAAWERVKQYFWETLSLSVYKETRNGMLEKNESSKLSPWLAHGCISARDIYFEVKKYEEKFGNNESTYWLIFELLWRDYFKFCSLKNGSQLFAINGPHFQNQSGAWSQNTELFRNWCEGLSGEDFVDANMRELLMTGWMSNRGRQNVASYLAKTIGVDWTLGAGYFERQLIDSDPESNWGNWQYLAGVGSDPRNRVFNIERQAQLYDSDKTYRKKWLRSI
jgi:deoxyribodipyrimidine photo-lyase